MHICLGGFQNLGQSGAVRSRKASQTNPLHDLHLQCKRVSLMHSARRPNVRLNRAGWGEVCQVANLRGRHRHLRRRRSLARSQQGPLRHERRGLRSRRRGSLPGESLLPRKKRILPKVACRARLPKCTTGSVSAPAVPRMHGAQPASRAASEYHNDDVAWRTTPKAELRRAEAREQRKLTLVKKFRPEADAEQEQATMVKNAAHIFWNSQW